MFEVRKDFEINKGNKHDNYIYLACLECKKERWVRVGDSKKTNHTGLCKKCCLMKRNGKLDKSPHWKGGTKRCGGNVYVYLHPKHPFRSMADKLGYVRRSRLVMARKLIRPLNSIETVHHINEKRDDDRIVNLKLFPDSSSHIRYHRLMEIKKKGDRPRDKKGRFLIGGYILKERGKL